MCQTLQTTSSEELKVIEPKYLACSFLGKSPTKFANEYDLDLLSRSQESDMSNAYNNFF